SLKIESTRTPEIFKKVRVIWESPPLPEDPIVWRKDLDPAMKEKVRAFFLNYGKGNDANAERERKLISQFSIGGFLPADDSHLLPVREMEANENYEEAQRGGNADKIAQAKKALEDIRAQVAAKRAAKG
ncbi:MAG TPA: PhnD/SsuA/transferrin family substrate-binding protein, partial [Caulobacteraceae bacterium]|nr:PhnD/SsuA/transferrin family substrate-binding protein [Caulobacteraceae bacterium]